MSVALIFQVSRCFLIEERNLLVDSIYKLYLPWNKKRLARIDTELDKLDVLFDYLTKRVL